MEELKSTKSIPCYINNSDTRRMRKLLVECLRSEMSPLLIGYQSGDFLSELRATPEHLTSTCRTRTSYTPPYRNNRPYHEYPVEDYTFMIVTWIRVTIRDVADVRGLHFISEKGDSSARHTST